MAGKGSYNLINIEDWPIVFSGLIVVFASVRVGIKVSSYFIFIPT